MCVWGGEALIAPLPPGTIGLLLILFYSLKVCQYSAPVLGYEYFLTKTHSFCVVVGALTVTLGKLSKLNGQTLDWVQSGDGRPMVPVLLKEYTLKTLKTFKI